jgi:hypothetical protein
MTSSRCFQSAAVSQLLPIQLWNLVLLSMVFGLEIR